MFYTFIGQTELIIVVLAILLLFGGRKIPELMKGLGTGIKEFQHGLKGKGEDDKLSDPEPSKKIDSQENES